ncbi:type II secretion system F family protein [Microbacterium invictum]|uniref:Tight adherence protein B n=1 Tax=Microbacterium invictum TaxID=515415 RepID=A0AA40SMD9_9MICO|nr:type II secretion system F family protein [Microbacterium invictum]MBB4138822.1 tight adherence protein B [Microbacterium invictum]
MTLVWGVTLAAGILLVLSPWLWPAGRSRPETAAADRSQGAIARLLQGAGYAHAPAARVIVVSIGAGLLAAALAWLITALPAVVIVAAAVGVAGPTVWLRSRARRLRKSRRALWPDVCDLLIASVRSGMSLPDAVGTLATSAPAPLRPAFVGFAGDMAASGHFDASALRLKAQLGDPVADRIVETLRMARQVGGTELTSVLRALSASVRADTNLRAEVESRQSWIRGAAVLGVVAPWVVLILLATRPEGVAAYTSPQGVLVILGGAAVSIVAYRLMLRVGRLSEPRRWFG